MSELRANQMAMARYLRDPAGESPPPGIEPRRLKIYEDLVYNNIESFISSGFPILRKLYSDDNWHKMVRNFFVQHQSHSPYFLKISEEFLNYLQTGHPFQEDDPAFIRELAHYEWVELALSVSDATIDFNTIDPNGNLSEGLPVLSPLAWTLSYEWPVHTLGPGNVLTVPPDEPTHIVVYRDRNDAVRFIILSAATAVLLNLLEEQPELNGLQACKWIAGHMQHPQPEVVIQNGLTALEALREKGILLGTRRWESVREYQKR